MHKYAWEYHKQHHMLTELTLDGYNAQYSSIVEHIIGNIFPVIFPAYMAKLSYYETLVWFCFAEHNSVMSHTNADGYHQIHHKYPNRHFSTIVGLFDRLVLPLLRNDP